MEGRRVLMAVQKKSNLKKETYYIHGNTVKRVDAVPNREKTSPERRRDFEKEREQHRRNKIDKRTRRNRERALYMNKGYVMFLTACACCMFLVCGCYIYLQSEVTTHLNTISSLEGQVVDLKSDNDSTLQRIETSIDLSAIKDKAINELGMVYPTSSQIVTYDVDESDTMTQYSDVPSEKSASIFK